MLSLGVGNMLYFFFYLEVNLEFERYDLFGGWGGMGEVGLGIWRVGSIIIRVLKVFWGRLILVFKGMF